MSFFADNCVVNISESDSGNGTWLINRQTNCTFPQEDIEATARNEFKAEAELDTETVASALGSKLISAVKISTGKAGGGKFRCHCKGGVEVSSTARGTGSSGTATVEIAGIPITLFWATGGSESRVFQDTDGGSGGNSPETITCQTNEELKVGGGGLVADEGSAMILDSKAELTVYGTCNGTCAVIVILISVSEGY